jgi:hypothetical protein
MATTLFRSDTSEWWVDGGKKILYSTLLLCLRRTLLTCLSKSASKKLPSLFRIGSCRFRCALNDLVDGAAHGDPSDLRRRDGFFDVSFNFVCSCPDAVCIPAVATKSFTSPQSPSRGSIPAARWRLAHITCASSLWSFQPSMTFYAHGTSDSQTNDRRACRVASERQHEHESGITTPTRGTRSAMSPTPKLLRVEVPEYTYKDSETNRA